MQKKQINVNDLADILKKHFGFTWIYIESVTIGRTCGQIEEKRVGAGGVLTIEFDYE